MTVPTNWCYYLLVQRYCFHQTSWQTNNKRSDAVIYITSVHIMQPQFNTCGPQQLFGGLWKRPSSKRMWPQRAASSSSHLCPDPSLPAHSCPALLHPLPLLIVLHSHESGGKPQVRHVGIHKNHQCEFFSDIQQNMCQQLFPHNPISQMWCS